MVMAQDTTSLPNIIPASSTSLSDITSASSTPRFTDTAAGSSATGDGDDSHTDTTGLVNYYFVFLALILCVAGLGVWLVYRKRKRAMMHFRYGREAALARDVSAWPRGDTWYRSHWAGRRRSAEDTSREEGLNELGEAPPAYAPPKTREEQEREAAEREGPAVPLQTLSREDAGLKPPDYTAASVQAVDEPGRRPSVGGMSSRLANLEDNSNGTEGHSRPQQDG